MGKIKIYINYLTFLLSALIPKKKNRWVFGAWFGNRISDNPFALYKYIKENYPNIDAVWVCNDIVQAQNKGIIAVKRNSLRSIWYCLTARVSVMNQGYLDFGSYNWIHHSYKVQLWHGVPWKKIGEDTGATKNGLLHKMSHNAFLFSSKCDLYIAPSDETRQVMKSAFLIDDSHILSVGQPRNEILLDSEQCKKARAKIIERIGDADKIILYMPTFRDSASKQFSFFEIADKVNQVLIKYNAVILEKQHYVQIQRESFSGTSSKRIINVEEYDTQELLASADVLITDYSSCFFDFLLRDKPIIHFLFDYDIYKDKERGLYYESEYVVAGTIAKTSDEVLVSLDEAISNPSTDSSRREMIRKRFVSYESKENSKTISKEIFDRLRK